MDRHEQEPTSIERTHEKRRVPAATETNGFAIASLVLGILWLWWIGSILALVFGYIGKQQIDRSDGMQSGRGLAIAGIALGWVGVGILLAVVVLFALGMLSMPWMPMMDNMR